MRKSHEIGMPCETEADLHTNGVCRQQRCNIKTKRLWEWCEARSRSWDLWVTEKLSDNKKEPWPLLPSAWLCLTPAVCPTRSEHPTLCLHVNKWGSRPGRKLNVFTGKFGIRRPLQGFSFLLSVAAFYTPETPHPPQHTHTHSFFFYYISKLLPMWIYELLSHAAKTNKVCVQKLMTKCPAEQNHILQRQTPTRLTAVDNLSWNEKYSMKHGSNVSMSVHCGFNSLRICSWLITQPVDKVFWNKDMWTSRRRYDLLPLGLALLSPRTA